MSTLNFKTQAALNNLSRLAYGRGVGSSMGAYSRDREEAREWGRLRQEYKEEQERLRREKEEEKKGSWWKKALMGGASGAAAGTAVNPGWGTAIGGALGAVAGALSPDVETVQLGSAAVMPLAAMYAANKAYGGAGQPGGGGGGNLQLTPPGNLSTSSAGPAIESPGRLSLDPAFQAANWAQGVGGTPGSAAPPTAPTTYYSSGPVASYLAAPPQEQSSLTPAELQAIQRRFAFRAENPGFAMYQDSYDPLRRYFAGEFSPPSLYNPYLYGTLPDVISYGDYPQAWRK